jgi:hypothetical protein
VFMYLVIAILSNKLTYLECSVRFVVSKYAVSFSAVNWFTFVNI